MDLDKVAIVSGIGCTGRVAGYVKLDSFHTTHGRAIPFATGLKLARPELEVVVFSGDGDLTRSAATTSSTRPGATWTSGHLREQLHLRDDRRPERAPTTPVTANTSTTPYGAYEPPFNMPHLARACGASYVARWTCSTSGGSTKAMREAMNRKGFRVIEVIAPCSTLYARRNRLGTGYDLMKFYHDNCEIRHGADPADADIPFQEKILLGRFVDEDRPTWGEANVAQISKRLGDAYRPQVLGVEA
jgi:2-oxoglutarate ferredoxin oxidoreductase subunit beta